MQLKYCYTKTKELVALSIPYTAANIVTAVTEQINTYILGRAGPTTLAASGIIALSVPVITLFNVALTALSPIISELDGKKDKQSIEVVMQQGWISAIILCIPQILIFCFAKPLLNLINQPSDLIDLTENYFYLSIISLPAISLLTVNTSYVYGTGKKLPMFLLNTCSLVIAGALNSSFILALNLGINGYAYGTMGQMWLNNLVFFVYLKVCGAREGYKFFNLNFNNFKLLGIRIFKLGVSLTAKMLIIFISTLYKQSFVGTYGTISIIAIQMANTYNNLVLYINDSIAQTVCILMGRAVGRKDYQSIGYYDKIGVLLALSNALLFSIPCFFTPTLITGIFLKSEDHYDPQLIAHLLYVNGAQIIIDSFSQILTGAFFGNEDSLTPTIVTLLTFLLIILPITLGLHYNTNLEVLGLAIGYLAGSLVQASGMIFLWRRKLGRLLREETQVLEDENITPAAPNKSITASNSDSLGTKLSLNSSKFFKSNERQINNEYQRLIETQVNYGAC